MREPIDPGDHFTGWRRHPKGRWFAVTTGATREACWDSLLEFVGGGGEAIVLESGRRPDRASALTGGAPPVYTQKFIPFREG